MGCDSISKDKASLFESFRSNLWIVVNLKRTIRLVSFLGEVVVAQLAERSLPIPEVCGSNPVIGETL